MIKIHKTIIIQTYVHYSILLQQIIHIYFLNMSKVDPRFKFN